MIDKERICRICGKKESEHPIWLVRGDWTHDAEWLRVEPWLRKVLDDAKAAHAKRPAWAKYNSVTLLAADNPNLGEYLAQLEMEQARLQARIKELVEQLRRAGGRCNVCGEYLPGHATGGNDICTCV